MQASLWNVTMISHLMTAGLLGVVRCYQEHQRLSLAQDVA